MSAQGLLLGCDFSSSPTRRKPVWVAHGSLHGTTVRLEGLQSFDTLTAWQQWLCGQPAWTGAFDLPFGLPRELVEALGWPTQWAACMDHYCALSRESIRQSFADFCRARPVGGKFAHRATDRPAGSSPSMKWVNPPVAFMLHAGIPVLRATGAWFPGLMDPSAAGARVALEAYPGLLARELLGLATPGGERRSYKADDKARQTPQRLIARRDLLHAAERGAGRLGLRLKLSHAQRDALADDPTADPLDAVLCLVQAAWGWVQRDNPARPWGLSPQTDPLEGWIVSA